MSLAMMMALIPTSMVFASAAPALFTIGEDGYGTLQDAVNACPTDGTETTIEMRASEYELSEQIVFQEGQNIVFTSAEGVVGEIKRASGYTGKMFEINRAVEITFDRIILNADYSEHIYEMLVAEKTDEDGHEITDQPLEGAKINFGKTVSADGEYPILKSRSTRLLYNRGAEVVMNSGTITGCSDSWGVGILYMLEGSFTMNGGSIENNEGTLIDASEDVEINITGGSITENDCKYCLIENNRGTLNVTGGSITENDCKHCLIENNRGTLNVTGGSITNNTCKEFMIFSEGNLRMTGGTISGNSISNNDACCYVIGNVGTFNMTGGSINNNSAGAVISQGQFVMSGGEIKGNANPYTDGEADADIMNQAGGICNIHGGDTDEEIPCGTVSISGNAVIKDNTKGTGDNKKTSNLNVVFTDDENSYTYKFDVTGEMGPDAYVGVDTDNNDIGDVFAVNTSSSAITNAAAFRNDQNPQLMGGLSEAGDEIVWTEEQPTPEPQPQIKVAGISISGISNKIAAGKKVQLTANVSPANASDKAVTWSSSKPGVATVDANGLVTVKAATGGKSAVITATAKDGSGKSASFKITSMAGAVQSIKLSGKKTVKAGAAMKLKAAVKTKKGKVNKKLKWTSSNPSLATVSSSGKVKTFKGKKGKVKITAMSTDGTNKKKSVTIRIR